MATDRVVAIGDVHGDLDALIRILTGMSILNGDGLWCANATRLVFIGDLNDRGPESVNVMDFVMALATDAERAGGTVDALLGNHELLAVQQDYRYMTPAEFSELDGFAYGGLVGVDGIFRGNSPYARWIRQRPTILKLGTTLFVHAGLEHWPREYDAEAVNALISRWVAYFQGVADSPEESTRWLIEDDRGGPLWTRQFGTETAPGTDPAELCAGLRHVLEAFGAERMVVGHVPTASLGFDIAFPHCIYGQRVVGIDTGISRYFGGRLSALELDGGASHAHYFDRGTGELPLTSAIRSSCVSRRNQFADPSAR